MLLQQKEGDDDVLRHPAGGRDSDECGVLLLECVYYKEDGHGVTQHHVLIGLCDCEVCF